MAIQSYDERDISKRCPARAGVAALLECRPEASLECGPPPLRRAKDVFCYSLFLSFVAAVSVQLGLVQRRIQGAGFVDEGGGAFPIFSSKD